MSQPHSYIYPNFPHHVCHLHRALYGLKQVPRAWYSWLHDHLYTLGFHNSTLNNSLFISRHGSVITFVLVYVDDILTRGSSPFSINNLISALSLEFAVKDLGGLSYFMGIETPPIADGLILSQSWYITNLLHQTKMNEAKPVSSPMSSS